MKRFTSFLILIIFLGTSCSEDDTQTDPVNTTLQDAITDYAELVYANYEDAHTDAVFLKEKIDALVAEPSATALF